MVRENARSQAVELEFRLLGPPQIEWRGEPFALPRRQARALLYRLASDLEPLSRDQLTFLFWPDSPEKAARRNLVRLLSYLRQTLPHPDLLLVTSEDVRLNPELAWSDSHHFDRLCASPAVGAKEKAAALYGGRFMDGLSLASSPEFETWLIQEAQRYERMCLNTLAELLEAKAAEGDRPKAIDYGQRYLAIDNLAETIHRQLISLYAAVGDRGAALRQYEQCAMVLERELGVPPLPETRAAYEAARDRIELPTPEALPKLEWATLPGLELPLIGRGEAWQTLEEAYGRYQSGGFILISGEPGVGKSRTMQEFATAQDALILLGHSHQGIQSLPYHPLVEVLRMAAPHPAIGEGVQPIWLAETARLLPELRTRFPDLPQPVEPPRQEAQTRQFEAMAQVLLGLAAQRRLLICLDDLHWADETTLGWLQFFGPRLPGSGLCLLATYRTEEATPLADLQRALQRTGTVVDVRLGALSIEAVTDIITWVSHADHADLASRIHKQTGGNTFFVLETVRDLWEQDLLDDPPDQLPIPASVLETVTRRVTRLDPLTQQVLEAAAVIASGLSFEAIQATTGHIDLEVADGLDGLVRRQILVELGDRFDFQHDLVRTAVYQNLTPWRKRLLHQRAANALLNLPSQERIEQTATIANHFTAAGDLAQAIHFYQKAAEAAKDVYAYQDGIAFLQKAIKLSSEAQIDNNTLSRLYESLADDLTLTGHFVTAEDAYRTAISLTPDGPEVQRAGLWLKAARTLPPQQREEEAVSIYQRVLDGLRGKDDTLHKQIQLDSQIGLLDALYNLKRLDLMEALVGETRALLDELGTVLQQADFYQRLTQIALLKERYQLSAESIKLMQFSLEYAKETGDIWRMTRQQFGLGFGLLWHGDLVSAEDVLKQALIAAEKLGDSWSQTQCLVYLTVVYRLKGNTRQAQATIRRLAEAAQIVKSPYYTPILQANTAWLHFRNGEQGKAYDQAQAAMSTWEVTPYPFFWLALWILLAVALQENRLSAAVASAQDMLDPAQMKLPDDVEHELGTAMRFWEAGDTDKARNHLAQAVAMAQEHGYL
jgi:DNA-binding SARP family transcriptional activator